MTQDFGKAVCLPPDEISPAISKFPLLGVSQPQFFHPYTCALSFIPSVQHDLAKISLSQNQTQAPSGRIKKNKRVQWERGPQANWQPGVKVLLSRPCARFFAFSLSPSTFAHSFASLYIFFLRLNARLHGCWYERTNVLTCKPRSWLKTVKNHHCL